MATRKRKVSKRKYQNAAGAAGGSGTGGKAKGGSATGGSVSGIAVGGDKSEQNIATGGSTIKKGNKKSSTGRGSSSSRGRGRGSSSSPSLIDRIKKKGNEFLDFIGFEDGGTSSFSNPMDQHGHGVQRSGRKRKR